MLLTRKLFLLALLTVVVSLPAGATRPHYPSPEEQIHRKLSTARERAGLSALERRDELDAVARARAGAIAARPAKKRLGGSRPVGEILKDGGGSYRQAVERLILIRNIDQVTGVMERWEADSDAWQTVTTARFDAVGYGTARADDGWIVFVAIMVRDMVIRNSAEEIAAMEQAVLERINRIRKERGLFELLPTADLATAARAHSRDMVANDFFGHADRSGKKAVGRVRATGMKFRGVAENLTMNNNPDTPAEQAVQDWMNSPGHRRNILDGSFQITGVGLAVSDDGRYYFTQLFLVP